MRPHSSEIKRIYSCSFDCKEIGRAACWKEHGFNGRSPPRSIELLEILAFRMSSCSVGPQAKLWKYLFSLEEAV